MSLLRALCCYQGDEGLSVGQYQLSCMPKCIVIYLELDRLMCGYIKQFSAIECSVACVQNISL